MKMPRSLLLATCLCFAANGHAATAGVYAKIIKMVLADKGRYGTCLVKLDANLAASGLNCPGNHVTFSCSGDFQGRDVAWRMYDTAQMAYTLDNTIYVEVDDSRKHNGFCFAPLILVAP